METLREVLGDAAKKGNAVGHFNFSDMAQFRAIVGAAAELEMPVVLGVSEGERDFVGLRQAVALARSVREELGLSIFLNADHTYDLEKVKAAAEAGCDSVIFDGAGLSLEENMAKTKEAVRIAKEVNPDILVEGEIGYIGKSSKVLDEVPEGAAVSHDDLPTAEQAADFVKATGVDLLAPAVGNIHGMFKNASNPDLDIERVREIAEAAGVPLVLHGGSGVKDEDFTAAIGAGIRMIHISTELRVAWREGLDAALAEKPDEIAPYKVFRDVVPRVREVVVGRLRLFNMI